MSIHSVLYRVSQIKLHTFFTAENCVSSEPIFKISQSSVVTQTVIGGITTCIYYIQSSCKFHIVYMCQKLWKLVENRKSYCNENQVQFFSAHPVHIQHFEGSLMFIVQTVRVKWWI